MAQPQTNDVSNSEALQKLNASWVNGVAPGYWATAGAGLTLNLSAGTAFLQGTLIDYAGGTLSLTDNATNYVYLDTDNSCTPSFSTSAFPSDCIPIAQVTTASGAITVIKDCRTMMSSASGAGIVMAIGVIVDGGGATPTTGFKGYMQVPFGCKVVGWTVLADQSGSVQFDVKKSTYSGFPTTSSIVASAPPLLSSAQKNTSTTLTGWTTAISAGDVLEFRITSVGTVQWLNLQLKVLRT